MDTSKTIKICYFPGRESGYARNRVLIKGMRAVGLTVLDCSCPGKNPSRYFIGFLKFLNYKNDADIIFVGFLGHFLMPLVKLCTRKKIIFDAFLSLYQTLVFDRCIIAPNGLAARFVRFIDRSACQLADTVILDTNAHIDFFVKTLELDRKKFCRVSVGSDDSVMYPRKQRPHERFTVHFHGEYQALHGAEYIVEAARLLPDIHFQMIGKGKTLADCQGRARRYNLSNVTFLAPVSYEALPDYIAQADVCLGIFGKTQKANLVIPHKVFEALACGKPLITVDTPSVRELLTDREHVLLCRAADPAVLAAAIRTLQTDIPLREHIAEEGYKLFRAASTPLMVATEMHRYITKLVS